MQIVIDIDEDILQGIIDGEGWEPRDIVRSFQATIADVIKNGTPLPKGHGRLIDADALNRKDVNCANTPMNFIGTAPTIIEADKGE